MIDDGRTSTSEVVPFLFWLFTFIVKRPRRWSSRPIIAAVNSDKIYW